MEEGRVVAVGEGGVVVLAVVGHGAGVVGEGVEMVAVFPDLLPELSGVHGVGGHGQVDCLLLEESHCAVRYGQVYSNVYVKKINNNLTCSSKRYDSVT